MFRQVDAPVSGQEARQRLEGVPLEDRTTFYHGDDNGDDVEATDAAPESPAAVEATLEEVAAEEVAAEEVVESV